VRERHAVAAILKRFRDDAGGSVAMEYALIGSIVSVAVIVGAIVIGSSLNKEFADFVPWLR
jgi:Flp pilus assembly pilin Flp